MGLRETINNLFRRETRPQAETTERPGRTPQDGAHQLYKTFAADRERTEVLERCLAMYKSDPRVKKIHRLLARDIVRGGYYITCKNNPSAQQAADALQTRLKLNQRLDDYVRLSARDGDLFLQVIIDSSMRISEISRKPTRMMHRNTNAADRFDDPAHAYWMGDNQYSQTPPADALWFAEWEIIHARWEHDEGERYGTPMMSSATGAYKKTSEGEVDVSVRRKTRSGIRYLHALEGASASDLETYKEANQEALRNPFAAVADFFTNKKGSISVLQGDGDLEKIGDVKHHIATMFAAGEVPMELVAYGEGLNRDTLAEKKREYDESLSVLRDWVSAQIIVPLLEREWLLQGILPQSVNYQIIWRSQSQVRPEDLKAVTDAAMRLRILGYSEEVIRAVVATFLPNIDPGMLMADADDDAAQRMADIMQQMRGGLA